jgi:hypothetical protein
MFKCLIYFECNRYCLVSFEFEPNSPYWSRFNQNLAPKHIGNFFKIYSWRTCWWGPLFLSWWKAPRPWTPLCRRSWDRRRRSSCERVHSRLSACTGAEPNTGHAVYTRRATVQAVLRIRQDFLLLWIRIQILPGHVCAKLKEICCQIGRSSNY